jgi:flagellar assembly protein FliH
MSAAARKFLFDVSFDGPPEEPVEAPVPDAPPPPASITQAELESAREAAFAAGRAAGIEEAEARQNAFLAAAMDRIAAAAGTLLQHRIAAVAEIEANAIDLVLILARKIAPELGRRCAFEELTAVVRNCLEEACDEPRLVVRVPDALFDAAKDKLTQLATTAGYPGKLVILADPELGPEDGKVEWADGGAERDMTRLWAEIDAAAKRAVETITQFRGDER